MDSITRIKDFIKDNFPSWEKEDYSKYGEEIDFRTDLSELYKIENDEIILISYTNISITGADRDKPQLRVFLHEYKKPFHFAKKHQFRYYLFSIFTKEEQMARGLTNFNPKEYIISIETNLDNENSRRDLRSIYDYANRIFNNSKDQKFLKCSRKNYKVDINEASLIYIGTPENPYKDTFDNFIHIFDSRPYQNSINNQGISNVPISTDIPKTYIYLLNALRTKPFLLLAGISGTGKSRIVRELAFATCNKVLKDEEGTTPGNYCIIEVKPNWHDSTELLGFYSNLSNKYLFKRFTNFIIKAMQHRDVPFFVCLDEMNLAPVEQYLAEFLSVLETRKKIAKGIVSGALVEAKYFAPLKALYDGTDTELTNKAKELASEIGLLETNVEVAKELVENGLTLPENLIVIGTVNMDDTTHQFSRKVIDRAMTIEMNGGNLMDMFNGEKKLEYRDEPLPLSDFKANYVSADEALQFSALNSCNIDYIKESLVKKLNEVNNCLSNTPFQISYRVLNELVIYLAVLSDTHGTSDIDNLINIAVDDITLMKILPRIEGDEEIFKLPENNPYKNRLMWLYDIMPSIKGMEKQNEEESDISNEAEETAKGRSKDKIKEMDDRLTALSFTRFWP